MGIVVEATVTENKTKEWWWEAKPVLESITRPEPIRLLSIDGWFLEKLYDGADWSTVCHYCRPAYWKISNNHHNVENGYCISCCEEIPKESIAAYTLHNWQNISSGKYAESELDSFHNPIAVFR